MMTRKRFDLVLEAETPIAHHEGSIGNHASVMRRKVRTKDGWEEVPCITADTLRHKLREASALALMDAAGLGEGSLSEAALRLLFNGGMVTGSDGGAVKLDAYRELVALIPSMGLFGGCAQNRIVPGRLVVEDAVLICEETERYISPWQLKVAREVTELDTHSAHVEIAQRVRMDASMNPTMRNLLTTSDQVKVLGKMSANERASETRNAIEKEATKSTMMPRTFERIAVGSMFAWSVEAIVQNEIDEDVLLVTLCAFLARAVVGGKQGTGHGKMRVVAVNEVKMARASREHEAVDMSALGLRVGESFRRHVAERKDAIRDFLREVAA